MRFLRTTLTLLAILLFLNTAYEQELERWWRDQTPLHRSPEIPLLLLMAALFGLLKFWERCRKVPSTKMPRLILLAFGLFWGAEILSFSQSAEFQHFLKDRPDLAMEEPCPQPETAPAIPATLQDRLTLDPTRQILHLSAPLTEKEYADFDLWMDSGEYNSVPFRFALGRLEEREKEAALGLNPLRLDSFRELIKSFCLMILLWLGLEIFQENRRRTWLCWAAFANGTLLTLIALYYYFFRQEMRLCEYRLWMPLLGYNNLAFYLLILWFICLPLWQRDYRVKAAMSLFSFLSFLTIGLTYSKTIMITLVFCLLIFWLIGIFKTRRKGPWVAYGLVILIMTVSGAITGYHLLRETHFVRQAEEQGLASVERRWETWKWAWEKRFQPNPWIGQGPGTFHDELEFSETVGGTNSGIDGAYVRMGVEIGGIGLFCYGLYLLTLLWPLLRTLPKIEGTLSLEFSGYLLALLVCLINGVFESALLDRRFQYLFLLLFALAWATKIRWEKEATHKLTPQVPPPEAE